MKTKNLALRGTVYAGPNASYGKLHLDVVKLDDDGNITCADYNSAVARLEMEGQFDLGDNRSPYACCLKNKEYYQVTNNNYKEFYKAFICWNTAFDYAYARITSKEGRTNKSYVELYVDTFADAFKINQFITPEKQIVSKEKFIEVMDNAIYTL